jgi:hypothetical protein
MSIQSQSQSQSYVTADGQSASLSCNKAPIWGLRPDFYYCLTVAGLLMWGALSDERTGLSFIRVSFRMLRRLTLYSIGTRRIENIAFQQFLKYCVRIRCRGYVFIESLPSDGLPIYRADSPQGEMFK